MAAGLFFSLAAGMMWGLVFVGPLMLPEYPAALHTFGRYLAFGVIALPLAFVDRTELRRLTRADWLAALRLAAIGNVLYYLFLASAIQRAGGALPTMIIGTLPVVIAVSANVLNHQRDGRFPWRKLMPALVLMLLGIYLAARWATRPLDDLARHALARHVALARHPLFGEAGEVEAKLEVLGARDEVGLRVALVSQIGRWHAHPKRHGVGHRVPGIGIVIGLDLHTARGAGRRRVGQTLGLGNHLLACGQHVALRVGRERRAERRAVAAHVADELAHPADLRLTERLALGASALGVGLHLCDLGLGRHDFLLCLCVRKGLCARVRLDRREAQLVRLPLRSENARLCGAGNTGARQLDVFLDIDAHRQVLSNPVTYVANKAVVNRVGAELDRCPPKVLFDARRAFERLADLVVGGETVILQYGCPGVVPPEVRALRVKTQLEVTDVPRVSRHRLKRVEHDVDRSLVLVPRCRGQRRVKALRTRLQVLDSLELY